MSLDITQNHKIMEILQIRKYFDVPEEKWKHRNIAFGTVFVEW
jgi:hypothetical protein